MRTLYQPVRPGRRAGISALIAALALLPSTSSAQTAPKSDSSKSKDAAIEMNPFEVRTDRDTSYGALNSTSITRFNTALNKVPISANIFTEDFMRDVDATDVNQMLMQYGAGMGLSFADAAGNADNTQPGDRATDGDRFASPRISNRGVVASYIRRDGFLVAQTNTNGISTFDIDRVEVLNGPQALLYGASGPGGVIVTDSKRANFNQKQGTLDYRIDQFGSKRIQFDANVGTDKAALRVVALRQDDRNRRLYIGDDTQGYYGQFAFKLPFRTIVRLEGEYTYSKRTNPSNISVNLGPSDPRNGDSLAYLLATNQMQGIDNGHIDWYDYSSFAGWRNEDWHSNRILQATVESVWTNWLSTQIGYNWNKDIEVLNDSGLSQLYAPGVNGNPLNDWAVNTGMNTTHHPQLTKSLHASALITKNLFSDRVKTQTAFGYDHEWRGSSPDDYGYFLSDANGAVVTDPTIKTNLGRTPMPTQWWTVDSGPLKNPLVPIETRTYQAEDGKDYSLVERNPINQAWVSPTNPWGTASGQYPGTGISGINNGPYAFLQTRVDAYYATNYTQWYHDWINTLVGYRHTHTSNPVSSGGTPNGPSFSNNSYNLGVNGRITSNLRWYASLSSSFDNPFGFSDPDGNPPPTSRATGREAGLKFNFMNNRISGQVLYYKTQAHDENVAYGFGIVNYINPNGLNGINKGKVGRNGFIPLDYTSDGEQLEFTAAPTSHWRIRVDASIANGRVGSDKVYNILYNDQFYTNGKPGGTGAVTYNDGSPFMVPTDAADIKKLTTIRGQTNPGTFLVGMPTEQLTTAMMSDPNSPYYAWAGTQVSQAGAVGEGTAVGKALMNFNKPGVGTALTGALGLPISDMQYAWPDPAHTNGKFIVARAGEKTVGYPRYGLSITNAYEFSHGWLKGLGLIVSLNNGWQYRTYYYNDPTQGRVLFSQPELGWQVNFNPYYEHKFGRFVWRTQLNIANLFNHYQVVLTPNNGLGYTRPQSIGVAWYGQPRSISWTNTIKF